MVLLSSDPLSVFCTSCPLGRCTGTKSHTGAPNQSALPPLQQGNATLAQISRKISVWQALARCLLRKNTNPYGNHRQWKFERHYMFCRHYAVRHYFGHVALNFCLSRWASYSRHTSACGGAGAAASTPPPPSCSCTRATSSSFLPLMARPSAFR